MTSRRNNERVHEHKNENVHWQGKDEENGKRGEEEKLYDNIMELISMHDYCYVGLGVNWKTAIRELKHSMN